MDKENEDFLKKEIESHSSALTNQRIADLLDIATKSILETNSSKPDPLSSFETFSTVEAVFLNTFPILILPQNKPIEGEINKSMKGGNELRTTMKLSGTFHSKQTEQLNQISSKIYYLIISGLQNCRYLFRTGAQEQKGIDAALEIFNMDLWKPKKKGVKDARPTETVRTKHGEQSKAPA